MTSEIRERSVEANGLRFACLEGGEGPLVLLLHGFPDIASTWSHVIPAPSVPGPTSGGSAVGRPCRSCSPRGCIPSSRPVPKTAPPPS